jgi:hypothetical protein
LFAGHSFLQGGSGHKKGCAPMTVDNYGTKFPNVAETIWAKVDE